MRGAAPACIPHLFSLPGPDHRPMIHGHVALALRHVDEHVDVVLVALHVLVLDEPLDLLLDHLLGGEEHVLEDVDELVVQLRVGDALAHLEDLDDGLLHAEDAELHDALVLLLARLLRRELQPPDQVDPPALLHLPVLQDGEVVVDVDLPWWEEDHE